MTGMAQIFLWLWLGGLGFLVTRAVTRMRCPWTVVGSALPVSMLCLLGTTFPLARLLGHPRGWVLALVALVATAALLFSKRARLNKESLEEFGFSPMQWACFMTLLTTAGLIMHTREVLGPEDDYWIHFPLISLLQRGDFPPPHPFFSDLVLHGHFGRDYLVAVLSWLSGGGLAQLSSTWIFNHTLQASAFFLAFGLGRRHGGTAGVTHQHQTLRVLLLFELIERCIYGTHDRFTKTGIRPDALVTTGIGLCAGVLAGAAQIGHGPRPGLRHR